jgi:hypothetical protein
MATKIEYRVVKEATNPPYYTIEYMCFDEKGEFIVGGDPLLAGSSIEELRDTLTEMQQALDKAVMDGIETDQIVPDRL